MEGRRGMNRGMQTMLFMLAMVASMAVVLLWEVSPFALNASHGVVLESPIQSFAAPGSDLEDLTKSYEPSQQRFPSLENTQDVLADADGNENKTSPSDGPNRDSSSSEVGTDLTEERENTPDGQSFTDLSQQQNMTGSIAEEREPTTVAEDKSTKDIPTTNGTQSTNELEAITPLESQQRSNDVAEPPETTSETENAAVTEKAMSQNSTNLNSKSTLQLEEPTGTKNNTVEEVASQGSKSEKQSSINQNITNANNQPQRRRKSSGVTQLSDELQLLENEDDSKVDESISSAVEDGKQAEIADAEDQTTVFVKSRFKITKLDSKQMWRKGLMKRKLR